MEKTPSLAPQALDHLLAYRWPGNVRELENAVERVNNDSPYQEEFMGLNQAIAHHIRKALVIAKGKVEGKGGAAELLEIHPQTLRHRMKKLGVTFGRVAKKKPKLESGHTR